MTYGNNDITQSAEFQQELAAQRTFLARVYGWMTIGLLITALLALIVASSDTLLQMFVLNKGARIFLLIAQFGVAMVFSFALRQIPAAVAATLFIIYAAITGITFSILLKVFTAESIAATFFITAGMFAGMSAYGYFTKRDLTGLGSFLMMGLWGLIIASIANVFMRSDSFSWLISFIGVIVFTGLTAYDTQKISRAYADGEQGSAVYKKTAVAGAFELYLDFVILFLYLLRFLGSRRD